MFWGNAGGRRLRELWAPLEEKFMQQECSLWTSPVFFPRTIGPLGGTCMIALQAKEAVLSQTADNRSVAWAGGGRWAVAVAVAAVAGTAGLGRQRRVWANGRRAGGICAPRSPSPPRNGRRDIVRRSGTPCKREKSSFASIRFRNCCPASSSVARHPLPAAAATHRHPPQAVQAVQHVLAGQDRHGLLAGVAGTSCPGERLLHLIEQIDQAREREPWSRLGIPNCVCRCGWCYVTLEATALCRQMHGQQPHTHLARPCQAMPYLVYTAMPVHSPWPTR